MEGSSHETWNLYCKQPLRFFLSVNEASFIFYSPILTLPATLRCPPKKSTDVLRFSIANIVCPHILQRQRSSFSLWGF